MKNYKRILAAVLSLSMVLGLSACGNSGDDSKTSEAAQKGAELVETAAESVDVKDGECVMGLSILSMSAEFLIAMVQGAQDKADELGVELLVRDCNVDNQTQVDQILDMINQEVDCIIVEPWDSEGITKAIDAATEANIPVFTVDTTGNSEDIKCWIASDNVEMGRMAGEYIAEQLMRSTVPTPVRWSI